MVPPLHFVEDFIIALMNSNDGSAFLDVSLITWETSTDGRVTLKLSSPQGRDSIIEMTYHLLNPSPSFREIVEEARSVVLAGGTMSPVRAIHYHIT